MPVDASELTLVDAVADSGDDSSITRRYVRREFLGLSLPPYPADRALPDHAPASASAVLKRAADISRAARPSALRARTA